MSSRYESKQELAEKVDYEGGVGEAINGYGISHIDLPDDTPRSVVDAWERIERIAADLEYIENWLES